MAKVKQKTNKTIAKKLRKRNSGSIKIVSGTQRHQTGKKSSKTMRNKKISKSHSISSGDAKRLKKVTL